MARVLIKAGADVNVTDKNNEAPLHFAAKKRRMEMVKLLLGAGADPQLCNNKGNTPAQLARDRRFNVVAEILQQEEDHRSASQQAQRILEKQDVSSGTSPGELMSPSQPPIETQTPALTPVTKDPSKESQPVCSEDKFEGAERPVLLQQAALDEQLRVAAERDDAGRLQELLAAGAKIESADSTGRRPLHRAAVKNASAAATALIEAGAEVEATDSNGWRPLHTAANSDASEIMKILLKAGANVDAANKRGRSALHQATQNCQMNAVTFLLEAGADLQLRDSKGKTPLQLAIDRAHDGVVKVLQAEADRRSIVQHAEQSHEQQEESLSDRASSSDLMSSTQPSATHQEQATAHVTEDASKEQQLVASQSQVCNLYGDRGTPRFPSGSSNRISKTHSGVIATAKGNRPSDARFREF